MNKLKIILWLSLLLFIWGCATIKTDDKKLDFFVETQKINEFQDTLNITKTAKLLWDQNIIVTSQVRGRVENIVSKEWDIVSKGTIIVGLEDTIQNYGLNVQRAQNALERAKLNYEQSKITIEKSIQDSKSILSQAENTYETIKKNNIQALKKAEQDLSSSNNQIENLKQQFVSEKNKVISISQSITNFSDRLLGVTNDYKHFNDDFERFLGVKDWTSLNKAQIALLNLYQDEETLKWLNEDNLTNSEIIDNIGSIYQVYLSMDKFLILLNDVLENSIEWWSLDATTLLSYKWSVASLKTNLNQNNSLFVAYKNQLTNMINQDDLDLIEETAKIYYEQTKLQLEKNIFDAQIALDNAKINYDAVVKNQETQLWLLKNSIRDAEIAYTDVARSFDKLKIKAPINWTIWNIYIDKGQEITIWEPIFDIINSDQQLLEIYISSDEYNYLKEDMLVFVEYDWKSFSGSISSISSVANNKTSLYKAIITLKDNNIKLIGNIGNVNIPVKLDWIYLPINTVNVIEKDKWYIYTYTESWTINKLIVELWNIRSDKINILTPLSWNLEIITSDINNYDSNKFILNKK